MTINSHDVNNDMINIVVEDEDRIPSIIIDNEQIENLHLIAMELQDSIRSEINLFDLGNNRFENGIEYKELSISGHCVRFEREAHTPYNNAYRSPVGDVYYKALEASAIEHRSDVCNDLSAKVLSEWFYEYGDDFWNGECFRVNKDYDLWPAEYLYNEDDDTSEITRWEMR